MNLTVSAPDTSFKGGINRIAPQMTKDLQTVLAKIDKNAKYKDDGMYFTSSVISKLKEKENGVTLTKKGFFAIKDIKSLGKDTTQLKVGRTRLVVENQTGKVLEYSKSIFSSWASVLKKIGKALTTFKDSFNDSKLVEQKRFESYGLTDEGYKRLSEYVHDNKLV